MGKIEKNDDYFTPYPKYVEVPDNYWVMTNYFNVDVVIEESNSSNSVNRTLKTQNQDNNIKLWRDAGYESVPTIEENIKELSESDLTKGILNNI